MKPALAIHALKFRYSPQPGEAAEPWNLSIAALSLQPGEQVLLTAGSGRGKSTLLHLIAGLLDPAEGHIDIAGTPVHSLSNAARDKFRGRHVGMIFQTFNLLQGFTALENVEAALLFSDIPAKEHTQRSERILRSLGITKPHARIENLSVGQQQRVAVARAVAVKPTLVLADEPTASLDPANASGAMDLIQNACKDCGAALLCVSHDPSMASRFERRVTLEELA
jgi:ABC-type lipoprotein export system ATPase subunit